MDLTPSALLASLRARGVAVQADGGRLRVAPASRVPAEMLEAIRARKAELLAILTARRPAGETGNSGRAQAIGPARTNAS